MEKFHLFSLYSSVLLTLFYAFTFIKGDAKKEWGREKKESGEGKSLIYEVHGRVKIRHFIKG